jgi:transcriptional regulator with XRE-family HTH domain
MSTAVAASGAEPSQLIAREIRAELGRQQMTNRRLAAKLGVSFMWVGRRISSCETPLTLEDVQLIATALDVPAGRFISAWLPQTDPEGNGPSPSGPPTQPYLQIVPTVSDEPIAEALPLSSDEAMAA